MNMAERYPDTETGFLVVGLNIPDQLFQSDKGVPCVTFTFMTMVTFVEFIVIPHQRLARVAIIESVLETIRSFTIRVR